MRIRILAVGRRMPAWVDAAIADYIDRFPPAFRPDLVELALGRRTRNGDDEAAVADEGTRMLAKLAGDDIVVALDQRGSAWSTADLTRKYRDWRERRSSVSLLIGGPDGLARPCMARADLRWSLSSLTLPHALARVMVIEQLYRAWTVLSNHPYHRA